jgi:two-component system, cell cycle response regulator DivK
MNEKTVLIVEDNYDNRVIYHTILAIAGYRVLEAGNGQAGVQIAKEQSPDLILMDLSMPVMDGWTAIGHLKEDEATREIPVCALSAHVPFGHTRKRARQAGFECYLLKPIEPKAVLQVVRERIGDPLRVVEQTDVVAGQ